MPNPSMMVDHPSWSTTGDERARRVLRSGDGAWLVTHRAGVDNGKAVGVEPVSGSPGPAPWIDTIDPLHVDGAPAIRDRLRSVGPVMRVRNPDVWEALATSIIRQVIRAQQARILHRRLCERFGDAITTPDGSVVTLFPTAAAVLRITDDEFSALGMTFFRRGLRSAAQVFLERGGTWAGLAGDALVDELRLVPRVGPWTAGATAADISNDFSLYPFADLAVRTWARRIAPSIVWPDSEREFGRTWRAMAGDQLSAWTLLTLAWGARHARSAY